MIHLLWPTCRPLMMLANYFQWIDKAVHPEEVSLKIVVDNKKDAEFLSEYDVLICKDNTKGVVKPLNKLLENFEADDDDILVVVSDDFYAPQNWDMYLHETMREFDGVLKVNDGHMDDIISIPIMRYKAFVKMNRTIYHPAYNHMFCDKELHDTANELGICRSVDRGDPVFQHRHPHFNSRESDSHDKANNEDYKTGKEIYTKRRYMTLQERMER